MKGQDVSLENDSEHGEWKNEWCMPEDGFHLTKLLERKSRAYDINERFFIAPILAEEEAKFNDIGKVNNFKGKVEDTALKSFDPDFTSFHRPTDSEPLDIEYLMGMAKTWHGNVTLQNVRSLHRYIYSKGLESLTCIMNHVISLYIECQSMHNAEQVLEMLSYRNEHSWTSLISGHVKSGQFEFALNLHQKMLEDCVLPSSYTLVALLKAESIFMSK